MGLAAPGKLRQAIRQDSLCVLHLFQILLKAPTQVL